MLASFSEFKFFQTIRVPVEEADDIRFLVEVENSAGDWEYVEDGRLMDVSVHGLGCTTSSRFSVGTELRISVHFKKLQLDLIGKVVRAFTGNFKENTILYGVELTEEDYSDMRRFVEQYIYSFNPDRLKDCLVQMCLTDRYTTATEGFEMFSLLLSLFKDMTNFKEQEEFVGTMLEEVVRIMSAKSANVYLINPDDNELFTICSIGGDKKKFDYRRGVAGTVFTSGLSLNLDIVQDTTRFVELKVDGQGPVKSVICNPIHNREDKVVGVIEVLNKRNEDRFTVDDEKTMKVLSLVLSSIFHNYNPLGENSQIRKFSPNFDRKHILIGRSKATLDLRGAIVKVKDLDSAVLVQGESGVGKSLFAKICHYEGKRGLKDYAEINCAGMEDNDVEKILFPSEGECIIDNAKGGTFFFHEIAKLSLALQKRVYDYIVANCYPFKEGGLEVRFIASSIQNLEKMTNDGKFNRDLYEFFSGAIVQIRPLRKRIEDIKDLVHYFLKLECHKQGLLLKSFSPSVMNAFLEYEWPGNVRELRACVQRAVLYHPKSHVISNINNMATPLFDQRKTGTRMFEDIPFASDHNIVLKDRLSLIERQMILTEIKRNNGNKSKAAREMGISREALRKKLMMSQEILDALEEIQNEKESAA